MIFQQMFKNYEIYTEAKVYNDKAVLHDLKKWVLVGASIESQIKLAHISSDQSKSINKTSYQRLLKHISDLYFRSVKYYIWLTSI